MWCQGAVGAAAMMMPPAAMFTADAAAAASFNGMMPTANHLPGTAPSGGTGVMMMNAADTDESIGWASNNADVTSNYLSAKPTHMVCCGCCCCHLVLVIHN